MRDTKLYIIICSLAFALGLAASALNIQLAGDCLFSILMFFGLCAAFSVFKVNPLKTILLISLALSFLYVLWPLFAGIIMFFTGWFNIYSLPFSPLLPRFIAVITTHLACFSIVFIRGGERRKHVYITLSILFSLMYAVSFVALNNGIKVTRYTIDSPHIKPGQNPIKIAHISDLHCTVFPEGRDIGTILRDIKPDIIFLTGDIADDQEPFDGCVPTLEAIVDIAPVYYVTGNHEHWSKKEDYETIIKNIKAFGITHLSDAYEYIDVNGNTVFIAGMDDPDRHFSVPGEKAFLNRFKTLNSQIEEDFDGLKLLLSHRPEITEYYAESPYDVIFSGHAHGGQIIVPFVLNGLFAPNQGTFPEYTGGVYTLDNGANMVVSRGMSIARLPRVFNPPELVIVTLE